MTYFSGIVSIKFLSRLTGTRFLGSGSILSFGRSCRSCILVARTTAKDTGEIMRGASLVCEFG